MKIILCIFLLNITAVSVFGQSVELNGILGKSIEFPAAVKKGGFLMYSDVPIGESSLGTPGIGKYSGRVQWDSCTGLFSLSGLKMEDIGEYKVQNTDKNITVFQLNLYKDNVNVSKPHVSITQNEYPCAIECTAERGTEATLTWYREGQTKPYSRSSVRSAPHLDLPQTVERSGTYTCEAKNSVSNEKASITVGDHCTGSSTGIIVAIIITAVVVLIAVVFAVPCIIRRRLAVRTLIQVKKLLDNVDLHAYGVRTLSQGVRTLSRVKMLLNNVDLHDYDETVAPDAVRTLIQVKKLLDNVDLHAYDGTDPPNDGTDPPNAVKVFIQVKKQLDNLDPHAYGVRTLRRGVRTLHRVKRQLDNVDLHDYDETVPPDALRTLIQVKILLDNMDLHAYGMFIYHPEATEKIPSSHETEVL